MEKCSATDHSARLLTFNIMMLPQCYFLNTITAPNINAQMPCFYFYINEIALYSVRQTPQNDPSRHCWTSTLSCSEVAMF